MVNRSRLLWLRVGRGLLGLLQQTDRFNFKGGENHGKVSSSLGSRQNQNTC
jgi:hypothetical protein